MIFSFATHPNSLKVKVLTTHKMAALLVSAQVDTGYAQVVATANEAWRQVQCIVVSIHSFFTAIPVGQRRSKLVPQQ
jgi:hypothetical protein